MAPFKSSAFTEKAGFFPASQSYYTNVPLPGAEFPQEPLTGRRARSVTLAVVLVACCMLAAAGTLWYHGRPTRTQLALPAFGEHDDEHALAVVPDLEVEFDGPDFVPDATALSDGAEMGDEIGRQLGEEIGAELDRQIGIEIGEEMGREIGEELGRQIDADMDAELDGDYLDQDEEEEDSVLRLPPGSGQKVKELLGGGVAAVAGGGRKALGVVGRAVGKRQAGNAQP